jgi:hypothetical protein
MEARRPEVDKTSTPPENDPGSAEASPQAPGRARLQPSQPAPLPEAATHVEAARQPDTQERIEPSPRTAPPAIRPFTPVRPPISGHPREQPKPSREPVIETRREIATIEQPQKIISQPVVETRREIISVEKPQRVISQTVPGFTEAPAQPQPDLPANERAPRETALVPVHPKEAWEPMRPQISRSEHETHAWPKPSPSAKAPIRSEPDDIQIHIGRIEVAAAPPVRAAPAKPRSRATSLDEYLRRRDGKAA